MSGTAPEQKENRMGTMPINKLLLTISVPIMLSMLVQALYNIVDSAFVAQINENALSAVSLAFPMQNFMIAIAAGTGVGVNALLSKSLGAKKQELADKTANVSIFLALMNWVVFVIIGIFFAEAFLKGQSDIPEILAYGKTYLRICMFCSLFAYMQMAMERLLQGTGLTFYSMLSQASGAIINIIMDPILIFGLGPFPKMGVAGAATATIVGQFAAMCLSIAFNLKKNKEIHFDLKNILPTAYVVKHIYAVAVPSILMISMSSVMIFGLNRILAGFTATAIAVFGVYFKLQSFVFMPIFGLNNGMVPIIAYNYGARKRERIIKTMKSSMFCAVSIMLAGLLIFQLLTVPLLHLFNASENMMEIGIPALRIISLCFLMAGFNIVGSAVFQALGNGVYSLLLSVARQLFVLLPAAFLLAQLGVLRNVWFAFPIAEFVCLLLCIVLLKKILKKLDF